MTQHNKSINSNIEEFLNYYCGLSHAPGFAVLLKGPWGSGKTWFIKKYITKLTEQKQKYLYVSLNGISSFSEIEEAFLVQQIPLLASKPVASTTRSSQSCSFSSSREIVQSLVAWA